MIKTKKQMFLVIGAFTLVLFLVGTTYAFFNYTRTGGANTVRTGQINFSSTQATINLTNAFPIAIDPEDGVPSNNANVGVATINITGDTTYSEGVEYLVSAVNVSNTVGSGAGAKTLPISIDVSVTDNTTNNPTTTLGNADADYFTNRGASANTSIYKVLAGETVSNNDQLLVGYIKSGATGVDGNVVIKAYIDASKVAISDTYNETTPETDEYGTTTEWVNNRTVFTTTEWNSLQTNGVSFKIKVESNEGTWVTSPASGVPTIASCPGCVFYKPESYDDYVYLGFGVYDNEPTGSELSTNNYTNDYREVITSTRKAFLGVILDEPTHKITRAFACGVKGNTPFCIEGTGSGDPSKYSDNVTLLNSPSLWNGSCTTSDNVTDCEEANPDVSAHVNLYDPVEGVGGDATVYSGSASAGGVYYCRADWYGEIDCGLSPTY